MYPHLQFDQLKTALSAHIEVGGEDFLYFGGTAYLGIPQDEAFLQYYIEGIKRFGLNNGTSRSNNVQLGIYKEAEDFVAQKFGAEAALITSSGYLAAQLLIKHFANAGQLRYAPGAHPALWLNGDPKTEGGFKAWATRLVQEINESEADNWVLISNSMNNLYPEIFDFSFVQQINANKTLVLIVDDSHGIGVNNDGLGAYKGIPKAKNLSVVVVASMAKALGVDAGLILGTSPLIQELKKSEIFLGASPPASAGLFALMQADAIYRSAHQKLQKNVKQLSNALDGMKDWHFVEGFPVFLSKNVELSNRLFQKRILISSFPYPDKDGPVINRVVLSSWHDEAAISALIKAI